jgi:cell division protein FtsW (lipid II flippase)
MHRDIRLEIGSHLEQLIADKQAEGCSREEAAAWAIRQMGDPVLLGKGLHQVHKPRTYWGLLVGVLVFSIMSLFAMWSIDASYRGTALGYVDFTQRQFIYVAVGIILMLVFYFWDFRKMKNGSCLLYAITVGSMVATSMFGLTVNGARQYISFGPIPLNWIGCSPYLLVVAIAGIMMSGTIPTTKDRRIQVLAKLLLLGVPCLIYVQVRALPELVMYGLVVLVLMGWLTRRWLRSALIALGAAAAGMSFVWNNMYMKNRIAGAINPADDPSGAGYMYLQQLDVIRSAGWWGHGFGSMPGQLPAIHSDMLIPYLLYSFGWVAGLLLLCAVIWFLARLAHAIQAVRDPYGRTLILVLSVLFAVQLVYGLAMTTGRVLITDLPFPFLGYGSHLMVEYAAAGLLLGIYRRKDIIPVHEVK